jgi:hypothetical protein
VNIIFIAVFLFFSPALRAMHDETGLEQEHFYPVLGVAERGSLQQADPAESASHEVRVVVPVSASSGQQIPKFITNSWFSKYMTKKNQQLLATHDFKDIEAVNGTLNSKEDKAYTCLVAAWTLLNNQQEEKKNGAADSVPEQASLDPKIEHAYMKAVLLELGAQQAKIFTDRDDAIKNDRKCCTRLAWTTALVAQLGWWGLYAAATAKTVGCWCFAWKAYPTNYYLYPYCH